MKNAIEEKTNKIKILKSYYLILISTHLCTIVHYKIISSVILNTVDIVSDFKEFISHYQSMIVLPAWDMSFLPGLIS